MGGANKGKGAGLAWLRAHVAHQGDECLIWPFSGNRQGYGQVAYFGKVKKAHHIMCRIAHGDPPTPRHQAAHSCGKGSQGCVHPDHLSWKTPSENRIESNEHGTGYAPKQRRLTLDQVEQIRLLKGKKSIEDLGEEFGVRHDTIGKIFRGETWVRPRSTLTLDEIRLIREAPEPECMEIGKSLGVSKIRVQRLRGGVSFQGVE